MKYAFFLFAAVLFSCLKVSASSSQNPVEILDQIFPGQQVSDIKPISIGNSDNLLYHFELNGEAYILRIQSNTSQEKNQKIYDTLKSASSRGVTPSVIYSNSSTGILVQREVDNQINTFFDLPKSKQIALMQETLEKLKKVESDLVAFDTLGHIYKLKQNLKESWGCIPPKVQAAFYELEGLNQTLATNSERNSFMHNDLHFNNLLYDGQKLWVIDFDMSGPGDPMYDLAEVINFIGPSDEESLAWLKEYLGRTPSKEDLNRLRYLRKLHHISDGLKDMSVGPTDLIDQENCELPEPFTEPFAEIAEKFFRGDMGIPGPELRLKGGSSHMQEALSL